MNKPTHATGSVSQYVLGFVLCLIFTFTSYYLVVNKTFAGNRLLVAIVCLAALQVLIQVFFFLHLGRGPKPIYNVAFFVATVGIIAFVIGGSLFIMSHLHYNMAPVAETAKQLAEAEAIPQVEGTKTGACAEIKTNRKFTIARGAVVPTQINASLCDTLSFINTDSIAHQIDFGTPAKPVTYSGQTSLTIRKGMSETITLNQTGTFSFYDHAYPNATGSFTVTTLKKGGY